MSLRFRLYLMPNKKNKEIIQELSLQVQQLLAALNESRRYADKLVEHIPYLPADIENLRNANSHFVTELDELKKENEELCLLIKPALEAARQFTLSDEFPGPYRLESRKLGYFIRSASGDTVVSTRYPDFATFMLNMLNAVDKHITLGE